MRNERQGMPVSFAASWVALQIGEFAGGVVRYVAEQRGARITTTLLVPECVANGFRGKETFQKKYVFSIFWRCVGSSRGWWHEDKLGGLVGYGGWLMNNVLGPMIFSNLMLVEWVGWASGESFVDWRAEWCVLFGLKLWKVYCFIFFKDKVNESGCDVK